MREETNPWPSIADRIRRGDTRAETELAEWFQPRIQTFTIVRTKDRELAREMSQDVLIAVICALREGNVRETHHLPAYVYGVARNRIHNTLRTRAREKTDSFPDGFDIAQPAPDVEAHQQQHLAREEIANLETSDRVILELTLVEGLKPGAIAARLGLSSVVVRQRKSRALKRVTDAIASARRRILSR